MLQRKCFAILLVGMFFFNGLMAQKVNDYQLDEFGLPTSVFSVKEKNSKTKVDKPKASTSNDYYYMIGNSQLTLHSFYNGTYQLFSGERIWSTLNQANTLNKGESGAGVVFSEPEESYVLAGSVPSSDALLSTNRTVGVGFIRYNYLINKRITCERKFSVKPTSKGESAFVINVKLKNVSTKSTKFTYYEYVRANYATLNTKHKADYSSQIELDKTQQVIKADFKATPLEPNLWRTKDETALYEGFPPCLFLKTVTESEKSAFLTLESVKDDAFKDRLSASISVNLKPNEEKELQFIVGFSFDNSFSQIATICNNLIIKREDGKNSTGSLFGQDWKKALPSFENESDTLIKRDLLWHAAVLEAHSHYNQYYNETSINTSTTKEQLQAIIPLCQQNKRLAKSALRLVMRKMNVKGDIPSIQLGYGMLADAANQEDNVLYFLSALAEYIKVSGDATFLLDELKYAANDMECQKSVLHRIQQSFLYLRDGLGDGVHGLVLRQQGESLKSTALTIKAFGEMVDVLIPLVTDSRFVNQRTQIQGIIEGMRVYRYNLLQALLKDWGTDKWLKQYYTLDGKAFGSDVMDIEIQALVLQLNDVPLARKQALWSEIDKQLKTKLLPYDANLILGLASFDKSMAAKLLVDLIKKHRSINSDVMQSAAILTCYYKSH